MVTLDKCLNRFSEVKKKLSKIDAKDPSEKPALKAVETEVKIIKVSLNQHKRDVSNFGSELKNFEQETKKLFQTDTSLLAESYREKVGRSMEVVESQARQLESRLLQMQSSVREDNGKLRRDAAKVLHDKYTEDVGRIARDLDEYATYLNSHGVASEELKHDLHDTYTKIAAKENQIAEFMKQNKGEQFNASRLLFQAQKQREKAHDLAKQLELEHELMKVDGRKPRSGNTAFGMCEICNASSASFEMHCGQHAFCAQCLTKYIQARTDQNLSAYCPGGCNQELFQEEIDRACQVAGQPQAGALKCRMQLPLC